MSDTTSSFDHLLANADWARRLARRLTRSPDDGDDLLQDALVASLERPTAPTGATRPWLTAVVTNLFRSKLRSDRRRTRRERTADREAADAQAPGSEETLSGLQIHRLLAELVADLPEPYRQTVTLRYFEDRSAADIAALSGVPAGTVRWRLKTGLDQIRARLDERHGGRQRWMALLAPFGSRARPRVAADVAAGGPVAAADVLPGARVRAPRWVQTARGAARPARALVARTLLGGTMVAVLVAGGLVLWRGRSAPDAGVAAVEPDPGRVPPGGGQPGSGAPVGFVAPGAGETLALCTRRIEDLRRRERDLLMKVDGVQLFEAGAPNSAAQAAIEGEIEKALAPYAQQVAGQALECRSYACRLLLLLREGTPSFDRAIVDKALDAVMEPRARSLSLSYDVAPDERQLLGLEAVGGERVHVVRYIHALEDVSGRPVPVSTLAAGEPRSRRAVHVALSPSPADRTLESCRAEALAADARVEAMAAAWNATKPLWVRFVEEAPDPALTRQVTGELRRALAALGHPWFHAVACRGRICRADADDENDYDKRNQLVGPIDDVIKRDPWFSRRVFGRGQASAVFFEVVEP